MSYKLGGCFLNSRLKFLKSFLAIETLCMTLILCSISQDCIPLLGFETRFSFELILCNQLLVSKVIFALLQAWTCKTRN